jgi:hypothetical protein
MGDQDLAFRSRSMLSLITNLCIFTTILGFPCDANADKVEDFCRRWSDTVVDEDIMIPQYFVRNLHFLSMVDFHNKQDELAFKLKYTGEYFTSEFRKWTQE